MERGYTIKLDDVTAVLGSRSAIGMDYGQMTGLVSVGLGFNFCLPPQDVFTEVFKIKLGSIPNGADPIVEWFFLFSPQVPLKVAL